MIRNGKLSDKASQPVICCVTNDEESLIAVGCEESIALVYDIRTGVPSFRLDDFDEDDVASLSFSPVQPHLLFAASGQAVSVHDLRVSSDTATPSPVQKYQYNQDEIGQITVNKKGKYLAAADDSGDIRVIDLEKQALHKTLRGGHDNICSSVQFRPHHPWDIVTGGLDSSVLLWDFGSGRTRDGWDMNEASSSADCEAGGSLGGAQMFNPPHVHSVAVGAESQHLSQKVAVVGRGDGAVVVLDLSARPVTASKASKKKKKKGGGKGGQPEAEPPQPPGGALPRGVACYLTGEQGGHTATASSVAFSRFNGGRHVISGGNDARLLLWDWATALENTARLSAASASASASAETADGEDGGESAEASPSLLAVDHGEKVNWICTTGAVTEPRVYVADTSSDITVYSIPT